MPKVMEPYDKKLYKSPIYRSWSCMKTRCNNPKSTNYSRWAELLGIKRTTLDMRLRHYRWPVHKALTRNGG